MSAVLIIGLIAGAGFIFLSLREVEERKNRK